MYIIKKLEEEYTKTDREINFVKTEFLAAIEEGIEETAMDVNVTISRKDKYAKHYDVRKIKLVSKQDTQK